MKGFQNMMKEAQKMAAHMQEVQAELAELGVEADRGDLLRRRRRNVESVIQPLRRQLARQDRE